MASKNIPYDCVWRKYGDIVDSHDMSSINPGLLISTYNSDLLDTRKTGLESIFVPYKILMVAGRLTTVSCRHIHVICED